jgi:hypothetical protein
MKYFHVHPDDAQWLRRWLRNNLVCILAIVGCVAIIRIEGIDTLETMNPVRADHSEVDHSEVDHSEVDHSEVVASRQLPAETELVLLTSRRPNPIAPQGWRRTAQGWEHVSNWPPLPRPLGEIIMRQQEREPAWIRFTLATIRGIPPLAFGMIQIAAIAAVVSLNRQRRTATSAVNQR